MLAPYNSNILKTSKQFNNNIFQTPEFQPYWGTFISNTSQNVSAPSPASDNIEYDAIVNGNMTVVGSFPTPQILIPKTAVYKVLASLQCNTTAGNHYIDVWPVINGISVPNAATRIRIGGGVEDLMTVEWFLEMQQGQNLIINFTSDSTNAQILALPALPSRPAIPSIITTILEIVSI
jgi:actin-related protein